jgi:hypothetical protein
MNSERKPDVSDMDEDYFAKCAERRIRVNELIEESSDLMDRTLEIINLSPAEWQILMSEVRKDSTHT